MYFQLKFNSVEQIQSYVHNVIVAQIGGYPRGGVGKMQILATTRTDSAM